MSLTVRHLNADTTFLLTFRPSLEFPSSPGIQPGTFSILLDPWLSGPSQILHPKFSISKHTTPSCISSLREIPEPDLVIISQDKPDHCHEATLRQLPRSNTKSLILAEPAAAKKIRSWKHFIPSKIRALERFDEWKPSTVCRFTIPAFRPNGSPGEVTVSFIPAKRDMTGLHNAIGITYRSPSSSQSSTSVLSYDPPLTPPDSRSSFDTSTSQATTLISHPGRERTMSLLYSPHGVTYPHIRPYAVSHLISEAALPLTVLLHSFDRVQNPWWLGGNISAGFPGGLEIARNLLAKAWISAHDEEKDNRGFSVSAISTRRFGAEEVRRMITEGEDPGRQGKNRTLTDVVVLDCGEELRMKVL
ncbi:MAG: hypothetical protein M1827_006304 [Pycnora praestabilis]|nr:MAG: hypothetical protein M1827_006304 [Pycnora praestabilis]